MSSWRSPPGFRHRGESVHITGVNPPLDIAALRRDYVAHGLRRADLDPDPLKQFAIWFGQAAAAELPDVNAMTLATVSAEGKPSARIVLLKGLSERGFSFFTNYASAKGRDIEQNPNVSLVFWWVPLERQIRINGRAVVTSREESEEYFRSRPRGSQLGAWASRQSDTIDGRRVLEARLAKMEERYEGKDVPLPPHWGGYCVEPETIEFWQGRANRLHDRFRYWRQESGWAIERLAP
jgi:pyridoxamine 5'-phosphate oxidase